MRARFYNPQAGARENEATSHRLLSPRLQVQELQAGAWSTRKALRRSRAGSQRPVTSDQEAERRELKAYPNRSRDNHEDAQGVSMPRNQFLKG